MFSYYPDTNDRYYHNTNHPFHAWKYEQEMRRRQQAIEDSRLQHEAFLQKRRQQQEEAFRRNQAKQHAINQLQEKKRQGYQVVQDWDGQLYLVPPHSHERTNNTESNYFDSVESFDEVRIKKPITDLNNNTLPPSSTSIKEDNSKQPNRKATAVLVEDVSDSEEENDATTSTLTKTLRNRRPSPGQWLEPVEMIVLNHKL